MPTGSSGRLKRRTVSSVCMLQADGVIGSSFSNTSRKAYRFVKVTLNMIFSERFVALQIPSSLDLSDEHNGHKIQNC